MNGIVIVDKPCGRTSHDIVSAMRKIYGTRRVGHTGTLDPMATGVLPICVGSATKAADMLLVSDKKYSAAFRLGVTTDTLDIEGRTLEERAVNAAEADVRAAVKSFIGTVEQLPPMYSAIKHNGKRLYEIARGGGDVKREKRTVTIFSIEITELDMPCIRMDVHCSKGTYIRSLCADIGERLGCGAVMTELRRTESGGFGIEAAHSMEELANAEAPERFIIPTDEIFHDYEEIRLNEKQEKSILNGVRMTWRGGVEGGMYRLYAHDGRFLCVSQIKEGRLVLVKSFWS